MEPDYNVEIKECDLNEVRTKSFEIESWDDMYCRNSKIPQKFCQYSVLNTIDQQRNFQICRVNFDG